MPAKTSPARVAAFFRALEETGNRTIAAERARVSRSWVKHRGRADPDFAARVTATVAAAAERLRAAASTVPPSKWAAQAGEELIVRGAGGRLAQVRRARLNEWTARVEDRFLAVLAATCNVMRACRVVGVTPAAAYQRYHRWDGFAGRWDAALVAGYERLEMALVENAIRSLGDAPDYPPDVPMQPVTFDDAFRLLRQHTRRVRSDRTPRIERADTIGQVMKQLAAKQRAGLWRKKGGNDAASGDGA